MKHLKKTIAAGALGVALLAGTATTFATWTDTDTTQVGTITTGSLTVTVEDAGDEWYEVSGPTRRLSEIPNTTGLNDFRLVPGNWVRGWFPITSELVGQDLQADFTFIGLTGEELSVGEDGTVYYEGKPTNIRVVLNTYGWDEARSDSLALDIHFDRTETPNSDDMNVVANLGNLQVTLTQR